MTFESCESTRRRPSRYTWCTTWKRQAESANQARPSPLPRCRTRSSPPPAGASGSCRSRINCARLEEDTMRILSPMIVGLLAVAGSVVDAPHAAPSGTFEPIASVVMHPRCINCHQDQSPRQGLVKGFGVHRERIGALLHHCYECGLELDARTHAYGDDHHTQRRCRSLYLFELENTGGVVRIPE